MPHGNLFEALAEHPDEADEEHFGFNVDHGAFDYWSNVRPRLAGQVLILGKRGHRAAAAAAFVSDIPVATGGLPARPTSLGDFLQVPGIAAVSSSAPVARGLAEDPFFAPLVEKPLHPLVGAEQSAFYNRLGAQASPDDVLTAVGLQRENGGSAPAGPDGEVEEYWSVEGPDGHVNSVHEVAHIRGGRIVDKEHEQHHEDHRVAGTHHEDHHGSRVVLADHGKGGHLGSRAVEEEAGDEPRHGHRHGNGEDRAPKPVQRLQPPPAPASHEMDEPQGPLDEEPPPGVPIGASPDEVPQQVIIVEEHEESNVTPSVVLGGALAIFAQVYLWSNVFVTLFKAPRRPAAAAEAAPGAPLSEPMAEPDSGVGEELRGSPPTAR